MGLFTDNDRAAMSFGVTYTVQVDKTIYHYLHDSSTSQFNHKQKS